MGVVAKIATSAGEQATTLSHVNGAVGDLGQATQQNAAMVEQTTASLKTLAQETDNLSELMRKFKTHPRATETRSRTPRALVA
jgi:methyl-accepting chemotaxis protein